MKLQTFKQPQIQGWTLLLVLVALFLIIGLVIGSNQPKSYPAYLTNSPAPTGIKGFYTYLHHHYKEVGIWQKKTEALPNQTNQLMVMVQPNKPFDKNDASYWEKWMAKGNSLLLMVDDPEGYFNLKSTFLPDKQPSSKVDTIKGLQDFKKTYKGVISTHFRLDPSSGDHPLLKDNQGVIALSHRFGKGQLMAVLAPDWFTNEQILKDDHVKLILPFVNRSHPHMIWFNERIHGYGGLPTFLSIYPKWFLFFFGDLLLVVLLWLWYKGKRFGPIEFPREWEVRFRDERLNAASAWYRRGQFYQEAITSQVTYLRSRIQEKWGISMQVDFKEMLTASERRLSKERFKNWQENWQGIEKALANKSLSHKAFLLWTNRLDEMRKEVDQA